MKSNNKKHFIIVILAGVILLALGLFDFGDSSNQKVSMNAATYETDFKFEGKVIDMKSAPLGSLVLTDEGNVYAFGTKAFGQLGLGGAGYEHRVTVPQKINHNFSGKPIMISPAPRHSVIATDDGSVYTFGSSYFGALGDGSDADALGVGQMTPYKVPFDFGDSIRQIATGFGTTYVLNEDRELFAFGRNDYHQLGLEIASTGNVVTPQKSLLDLGTDRIKEIHAGGTHLIVLTEQNKLYTIGDGSNGQLGTGNTNVSGQYFQSVSLDHFDDTIKSVSSGRGHTVVVTNKNSIYSFGKNDFGQLGLGISSTFETTPQKIDTQNFLDGIPIQTTGFETSYILTDTGNLYAAGRGTQGTLGDGSYANRNTFELVDHNFYGKIVKINTTGRHVFALTEAGFLYSFGLNDHGQLGIGVTGNRNIPQLVNTLDIPDISINGKVIKYGQTYYTNPNFPVSVTYTAENGLGTATYNGENTLANGRVFIETGTYELEVSDVLGNTTKVTLVIEDEPPEISLTANGEVTNTTEGETYYFNSVVEVNFTDESGIKSAKLDGIDITNGHQIPASHNKTYTLEVVDNAYNKTIIYILINTQAPEITIDTSDITHEINTQFTNPTCTATDYTGATVPCEFSNIDVTTLGEQTLEVTAVDSLGNKMIRVIRVKIVDNTAPTIDVDKSDIEHEINTPFVTPNCVVTDNSGETIACHKNSIDVSVKGEQTLTITAEDSSGNVTTVEIKVTIVDTTAPTIDVDESDIELEINTLFNNPTCMVTDNSGEEISCQFSSINTGVLGEQTLTITATDSSGNKATKTIKVTIVDTTKPVINMDTSDIEHEINTTFTNPTCSATDNSGESLTCSFSAINTGVLGEQTLTVTATDISGNKATKTIKVTIVDTTKPVINMDTSDIVLEINTTFTPPTCSVTDNSGESLTCGFSGIDTSVKGEQTLTVTAVDSSGNTATKTIKVTIKDTTKPEIIIVTTDINHEINTTFTPPTCSVTDNSGESLTCSFNTIDVTKLGEQTLTVTATDSSGNIATKNITVKVIDTKAPVINIDHSDIVLEVNSPSPTPTCNVTDNSGEKISCVIGTVDTSTTGTKVLTVTATDSSGNKVTETINVIVVNTTVPPTITVDDSPITVEIKEDISSKLPTCSAVDIDGNSVDCVFGAVDTNSLGQKVLTITATDKNGNTGMTKITVNVVDTTKPVINMDTSDINHEINTVFSNPACSVTDNSGESLTCSFNTISVTSLGEQTLTVTATDSSGNKVTKTIKVIIVDTTKPTISVNISDIEHEINTTFSNPTCNVTDNSGESLTCNFTTINTGVLGEQTLTITATDSSGNTATKTIKVTIVDTTKPEITISTADINHEINATFTPPTCSVTDNSGENLTCSFSGINTGVLGEQTLTVTATDSSGNSTTKTIKVTIVDTKAPVINVSDEVIKVEINGFIKIYPTCNVVDNSGESLNCQFGAVDTSKLGDMTLAVTATDSSGNTATKNITVKVIDTKAPVIDIDSSDIVLEVNSPSPTPTCTVTDNSKETISCVIGTVDTSTLGTKVLTITATDSSGNTATENINVIIINTTNPPTITVDDTPIKVEINEDITSKLPTCNAVDISGNSVECVFGTVDTNSLGQKVLTITATDSSGNTATKKITVNVVDTTKPIINVDTSDINHEINTAFDNPSCNVTDNSGESLTCSFNTISVTSLGEQTLTVTATDSSGNTATKTIKVIIVDTTKPTLSVNISDIEHEINTTFSNPTCNVTDNSGESLTCNFNTINTSKLGEQTLTITATDSSGNTATKTIKVTIVDTTKPEITINTADIKHEINTTFTPPTCSVTDNSGESLTCSFSAINTGVLGEQTLTVTATDSSGNSTTKTIEITIVDTKAPTIYVSDDVIKVEINGFIKIYPTCNVVDNSGEKLNCQFGAVDTSKLGDTTLAITATDSSGNTATKNITVKVIDTKAPTINIDHSDIVLEVNSASPTPTCTVTDNSKETISCVIGTVDTSTTGTKVLSVTATDSSGNKVTETINVIVVNTTVPPTITVDDTPIKVEINEEITSKLPTCTAVDIDGNSVDCTFGAVDTNSLGQKVLTITATDKNGNIAITKITVNVVDTTKPVIDVDTSDMNHEINTVFSNPTCNVTDNSGESLTCNFTTINTDKLGEQILTITATDSSGNTATKTIKVTIVDTTKPEITISTADINHEINTAFSNPTCSVTDNSGEEFSCQFSTINTSKLGEQTLTITATDSSGNKATKTIKVTIVDTTKPEITINIADIEHEINTTFSNPTCSVTDNSGESLTCSFSPIDVTKLGEQTLTITATDSSDNVATKTIKVIIVDTKAPVIYVSDDIIKVEINSFIKVYPICTVVDNSGEKLNCKFGAVDTSKLGDTDLVITATDSNGNTATKNITVKVIDTKAPTINVDDEDITIEVNTELENPICGVIDNSKEQIECKYSNINTGKLGKQLLEVTATDSSGNTTTKTINVYIEDTKPPEIVINDKDITSEINNQFINPRCGVKDNSKEIIFCKFSEVDVTTLGEKNVTITATDSSGNTATKIIKVRIIDETPPKISVESENINHLINTPFINPRCEVTDNSLEIIACGFSPIDVSQLGKQNLTITATDLSQNTTILNIVVNIIPQPAPYIDVDNSDIIHEINADFENPICIAIDYKGEEIECSFSSINISKLGQQILTITATDNAGTTSTIDVIVNIVDTTAPEITVETEDIYHKVNEKFNNPICTVTDNSNEQLECRFSEIDINTVGEQLLTISAMDASGNAATKTIKVFIVKNLDLEIKLNGEVVIGGQIYYYNEDVVLTYNDEIVKFASHTSGENFSDEANYDIIIETEFGTTITITLIVDKTMPTITLNDETAINGQTYTFNNKVTLNYSDSSAIDSSTYQNGHQFAENGTYTVKVVDKAGNEITITIVIEDDGGLSGNILLYILPAAIITAALTILVIFIVRKKYFINKTTV